MKKFLLILATLSLFLSKAQAVEMSLHDCISMALKNNKGLKTFEMDLASKCQDVKISQTHFLPSLRLEAEGMFRNKSDLFIFERDIFSKGIPLEDIESSIRNQNTYGINLIVEQPLFTGGYLTHSYKKSKIIDEQALYEVKRQRKLLVFKVKNTFYDFLKERSWRKALEKVIEAKKARISLSKKRYKEGYIKKEDILQMETDLAFVKLDLHKCKVREDLAHSRVKQLIYYEGDDEIFLKGEPINGLLTASLQEVKEAALHNREELEMSLLRTKAIGENIEITKSKFYPQASLRGSYTLQKETNISRPQIWALGVRVDWSIFEWGRVRAEVMKVEASKQRLVFQHEELQRDIMIEVEEAWRAVKEKEELVKAHEKKLKLAEYKMGLVRDRYSEGKVTVVEITEEETELIKSYSEYLVAISGFNRELAHLEASISFFHDEWISKKEIYQPV